jgi:hypothetical protein
MPPAVGRFTSALFERGRTPNRDSRQSLVMGGRVLLEAAVLVIVGRFANELFIRAGVGVVLKAGWRDRAVENAGRRYRADENVRLGTACWIGLVPRYPEYFVVLCGAFLWLVGICAPAISASATIPVKTKRALRMIYPRVFNFVNKNTGRSLKLRWFRECLRVPSAGP